MHLRRVGAAGLLSVALLLALSAPSMAARNSALNRFVDGPFTGSGTTHLDNPDCPGVSSIQDFDYGAGEPPPRSGTLHLEICLEDNITTFVVEGTFELTSTTGATLSGLVEGTATLSTFENTYTVTKGTRMFRNVAGSIHATATFDFGPNGTLVNIQGDFVGSLIRQHP